MNFINFKKDKGFTLTELLVVIAIIGILTSVVVVATNSARIKGRDAKRKVDIDATAQALEIYYAQNKKYPNAATYPLLKNFTTPAGTFYPAYITSWTDDSNYSYIVDTSNFKKFVLDAKLEGTDSGATSLDCSNASAQLYWTTGVVTCTNDSNSLHYRRASQ